MRPPRRTYNARAREACTHVTCTGLCSCMGVRPGCTRSQRRGRTPHRWSARPGRCWSREAAEGPGSTASCSFGGPGHQCRSSCSSVHTCCPPSLCQTSAWQGGLQSDLQMIPPVPATEPFVRDECRQHIPLVFTASLPLLGVGLAQPRSNWVVRARPHLAGKPGRQCRSCQPRTQNIAAQK